jgi:hypothetical protein
VTLPKTNFPNIALCNSTPIYTILYFKTFLGVKRSGRRTARTPPRRFLEKGGLVEILFLSVMKDSRTLFMQLDQKKSVLFLFSKILLLYYCHGDA